MLRSLISAALQKIQFSWYVYTCHCSKAYLKRTQAYRDTRPPISVQKSHVCTKSQTSVTKLKQRIRGEGQRATPLSVLKNRLRNVLVCSPFYRVSGSATLISYSHTYKICHTWTPCQLCPRVTSLTVLCETKMWHLYM